MGTTQSDYKVKFEGVTRTVIDKYGRVYLNFEPGNQWYVDSGVGSSANDGKTWGTALDTIKNALAKATASNSDVIWVAPGHTETISSATSLALNKAGVTIIGLGGGAMRPTLTFSATASNIPISAASVHLENILCVASVDSIVAGITISAADVTLKNIEWRDVTDKEAILAILTTAAADRLTIDGFFHNGFVTGNACTAAIRLVGVDSAEIKNCRFHGNYGTAIIEFHTTKCTKIDIMNCIFEETGTTDFSKNVVDTVTGSTWYCNGYDLAAGQSFGGGSGAALAGVDVSSVATDVTTLKNVLYDTTGIASWAAGAAPANGVSIAEALRFIYDGLMGATGLAAFPAAAVAANDVSMAEVLRATQEAVINGTGAAMPANQSLYDLLAGTGGIATFPAAAVPGNNVSLAEVIRDIWDSLRNGTGGSEPGTNRSIIDEIRGSAINYGSKNYLAVTADMSSATWNTAATHELFTVTGTVRMRIVAECTTNCTSSGGGATICMGVENATNSFISATGEDDIDAGDIWCDATPTETNGDTSSLMLDKIVAGGLDVGYEIAGEAFTEGSITFHCWYEAISSTGAVAAGAGGAMV